MKQQLNQEYWSDRYQHLDSPWDTGSATPPLRSCIDSISDKDATILIPGCGSAHEAIYAYQKGYKNVYILDWSPEPLLEFKKANPFFPESQILCSDFFTLTKPFDVILEQTFFCAIDPDLRSTYVTQCAALLNTNGILMGLFFSSYFDKPGPPFGGTIDEYIHLFSTHFQIRKLEPCTNSIAPRMGNELIFEFVKK